MPSYSRLSSNYRNKMLIFRRVAVSLTFTKTAEICHSHSYDIMYASSAFHKFGKKQIFENTYFEKVVGSAKNLKLHRWEIGPV
jgi:hypothetical protein